MSGQHVSTVAKTSIDVRQGYGESANTELAETFQDGGMELN